MPLKCYAIAKVLIMWVMEEYVQDAQQSVPGGYKIKEQQFSASQLLLC